MESHTGSPPCPEASETSQIRNPLSSALHDHRLLTAADSGRQGEDQESANGKDKPMKLTFQNEIYTNFDSRIVTNLLNVEKFYV